MGHMVGVTTDIDNYEGDRESYIVVDNCQKK